MIDSEPTHDNPRNTRNLPAVVQPGDPARRAAEGWLSRAIRTLSQPSEIGRAHV